MEKFKNIQALRAVAALMVLWAHLKFAALLTQGFVAPRWMQSAAGASGVDLFFVISGYVIAMTAVRHRQSAWHFFRNRVARVVPVYYVFTLVLLVHDTWKGLFHVSTADACSLWNSFAFIPIFDVDRFNFTAHPFGWTLCLEMWFYVFFTFFLAVTSAKKAVIAMPLALLLGVVLSALYPGRWLLPHFLFHPLCLEFAMGSAIFSLEKFLTARNSWIFLGLGLALYVFVVPRGEGLGWYPAGLYGKVQNSVMIDYLPSWERVGLWGVPAALLFSGLLGLEKHAKIILPRPLVTLGDASYSLYLIQPLGMFATHQISKMPHCPGWLSVTVFIGLTVGLAPFSWRYLELPLTHLARRWLGIAPRESLAGEPTLRPGRGK